MKYMLMMNHPGNGPYQIASWPQEDLKAPHRLHDELRQEARRRRASSSAAEGLAGPDQAKLVRAGKDGKPITDGVFPESKEFLAGYWIVDVDSPGARLRDRRRGLRRARARRRAAQHAHRGAPGHERPAARHDLMARVRWTPPPSTCCASSRRRCWASSSGASATSPPREDAVQEALIAAATQWPREGMPDNPRAWLIQVASRRITDHVRAEAARRHREAARRQPRAARRADRPRGRQRRRDRARRHARPALHVLPPRALARVRDRAHAARRRRPDDRRDRPGLPGAGGDDGAADQPRQADHQGLRRRRSRCPPPRSAPRASAR